MSRAVIDASALLALLGQEPGSEKVVAYLPGSYMSVVNLAEVVGKLAQVRMPEIEIRMAIDGLGIEFKEADERLAWRAALLQPDTRKYGLSLADLHCFALADDLGLPAITSDKAWQRAPLDVEVVLIR